MADENEYDIYDDIDVEGSDPTDEELEEAGFSGSFGGATAEELEEIYGGLQEQLRKRQETIDQYGLDETASLGQEGDEFLSTYESKMREAKRAAARRASGLTGDRIFEYAERLKDIAEGRRKTEGQIEAEKQLAILSQAQRGRAMGLGGFDTAELLQRAGRSAQQAELGGETAIAQAARQAKMAAKDQLEQLRIAGEQRAEDRAFNMQRLAFQEEQAKGALWSNVLSGVLGAVGTVIGAGIGGPAGAVVGGSVGSGVGKAGQYLG